jgi:hypothetical protein
MAVGKVQPKAFAAPQYYLFEHNGQCWVRYQDYTNSVNLPGYLADPGVGYVMPLSTGTKVHDYMNDNGHSQIGTWIDQAAQQVGR